MRVAMSCVLDARFRRRTRQQAFALGPLAGQLARAAHGFGLFARPFLRRLFVMVAPLHFPKRAFALHFFLQRFQRLIDVVVANENLNQDPSSGMMLRKNRFASAARRRAAPLGKARE
jgi:hypothetical protein